MRRLVRRLLHALQQRRHDDDLADEIAFHRDMAQRDLESRGLSPAAATDAARRALGNDALARNQARDVWISPWLQDLSQDVRFAARLLIKDPRFAIAAVAALALGIGANTAAFTFVNAGVLRALPLADPDQLVAIRMVDAKNRPIGVSYADARDWRQAARSFSHLVVSFDLAMNVTDEGLPAERYGGSYVTPDMFPMVGRAPLLGRAFVPEDDRLEAPRVAIIAHTVWTTRYGSDPAIVGRTIRINDTPTTIIGVMPPGFHFPAVAEVWQPSAAIMGPPGTLDARRGVRNLLAQGWARLAPDIPIEQAQAEMDGITSRLAADHPETNAGMSVRILRLDAFYREGFAQMLLAIMGAVVFVLLIACVNVANLLLARASERSREIAVRASLGGTRWRIVRQLLIESALLASIAGVLGLAIARASVRLFERALTETLQGPPPFFMDNWSMDGRSYLFLAVLSLATVLLFGLAPALYISKTDVNNVLRDGGRGATSGSRARRWTSALMVGELALTMVLLVSAGLMVRTFLVVYQSAQVLDTSDVLTMRLSLSGDRYASQERIKQFFEQLDARLAAVPALGAVTVASDIPLMTMSNSQRELAIEGRPTLPGESTPIVAYLYIGPSYFRALGLRLLQGREFTEQDGLPGQETAIVNQRFAAMFFPNGDALGQRIQLTNAAIPNRAKPWFTIVGIAPTIPQRVVGQTPEPVVYVSVRGEPGAHRFVSVIARTTADKASAVAAIREEVRKVDPTLAGYSMLTMNELMALARWPYRVFGAIFALLAAVALVLASVGLYALTAHGVVQRTQEIGVRMALGARSSQVQWLFVRRTVVQLGGDWRSGWRAHLSPAGCSSASLWAPPPPTPSHSARWGSCSSWSRWRRACGRRRGRRASIRSSRSGTIERGGCPSYYAARVLVIECDSSRSWPFRVSVSPRSLSPNSAVSTRPSSRRCSSVPWSMSRACSGTTRKAPTAASVRLSSPFSS